MISPGASPSSATLLPVSTHTYATSLCCFRCIGGDHDCAAAPRDPPWRACKVSEALRLWTEIEAGLSCRLSPSRLPWAHLADMQRQSSDVRCWGLNRPK